MRCEWPFFIVCPPPQSPSKSGKSKTHRFNLVIVLIEKIITYQNLIFPNFFTHFKIFCQKICLKENKIVF